MPSETNFGYSNHILNTGHTYGTITDTMDIVKTGKNSKHLNTSEKYCIYRIIKDNLHIHRHITPYSKHYTSFTPDSSTHTPRHIANEELVTENAYNTCKHKSLNITSLTVRKNL
jgi:hypothetical protein